jgi:hypothetical protein
MNGGVALPIPESDRERIKALSMAVARGRAAQMQLTGYVQSMAIEAGISLECEVRIVGEDVLFLTKAENHENPPVDAADIDRMLRATALEIDGLRSDAGDPTTGNSSDRAGVGV